MLKKWPVAKQSKEVKQSGRVVSWSASAFNLYKSCAAKFKYKNLDKLPEEPNPAFAKGLEVHTLSENYLKGKIKTLPKELSKLKAEYAIMVKSKAQAEASWCFDKNWEPTDWFGKNAWLRIKVDILIFTSSTNTLTIIDIKTGKPGADYKDQVELYALGGFLYYDGVEFIETKLMYVDTGIVIGGKTDPNSFYKKEQLPALKAKWQNRVVPMFSDITFTPNPSYLCNYCSYSKDKGGPCAFRAKASK